MVRQSAYLNASPTGKLGQGASRTEVLKEFGKRLQRLMAERGWNQSDLARHSAKHMPDKKFGRDNISGYICGENLPGPAHLNAMAKALGLPYDELLPTRGVPDIDSRVDARTKKAAADAPLDVRDLGEGKAWLRVNQEVPWDVAIEIMKLVKQGA